MKITLASFITVSTFISSFGQQITISDLEPLNIRSDANNVTLFVGLSTTATNGGRANTFVGYQAGQRVTSGAENTIAGYQAGFNSLGSSNLFLGAYAGFSSVNSNSSFNTFIGQRTGYSNTSGFSNIFLGSNAGYSNLSGNYNTFIGNSAGQQSQLGSFNTFLGNGAGYNANNANYNLFIGAQAGFYTTTGNYNVILGQDAGLNNKGGNNNTFIGKGAGGDQNSPNLENATAIGANTIVSANNSLILGNSVNVGIGNSTPKNKLEITQGTNGNSGLRFTNLTRASQAVYVGQTKFLTVNDQGDVVLGSTSSSPFREAASHNDVLWKSNGSNIENSNEGGVIIGPGIDKIPSGYRLLVADGILTEKVKVAVKTTNDWSDHVFQHKYSLLNLLDLEQYVIKNQHLPGIPSAKEVVNEGIDLAKMDAKLLEKIEELALYTIQLKKISQKQEEEIKELKKLVHLLLLRK
ncbi:hypothetical protein GCM10028819_05350 [Spirosoma humi]